MILSVTALQALDEALTAAHRLPQPCGHPKADLRICARCSTVLCRACDAALDELMARHYFTCRGRSFSS